MARIYPFQPYRYSKSAGALETLVTQPYDKITPRMRSRYLALNPHNLVRVILGERLESDNDTNNVYTRAAKHVEDWIRSGILSRDSSPALFAYFQEFRMPDTGEQLLRKGFIGLGAVDDYAAGTVHRHEQTLSGPKKDRMELLRHTRTHCGQLFMLYPDREGAVERILDEATKTTPAAVIEDEYGVTHRLWRIGGPAEIARIQELMTDKKLLIADGHHRYETALAFRNDNPGMAGADKVMMTFVNMYSPGLRILATHRLVRGLENFRKEDFLKKVRPVFRVRTVDDLRAVWNQARPDLVRIGVRFADSDTIHLLEADRAAGQLDVRVLHEQLLGEALGIGEEAVRNERFLRYARGLDAAVEEVRNGEAQIAFLLEPVSVEEVGRIAFGGGVMPQKSTDFYPKLLSGLTMYRVGE